MSSNFARLNNHWYVVSYDQRARPMTIEVEANRQGTFYWRNIWVNGQRHTRLTQDVIELASLGRYGNPAIGRMMNGVRWRRTVT